MSDYQDLLKELETVLSHTAVSHYTIVSSLCLYAYDFSFAEQTTGLILAIVCIGGAQVIMQLRVHALYGQNRALKVIISLLFFLAVSTELGIASAKLATNNGYIQPIPFLIDPLKLCVGTIPKFLILYTVPMMVFDTVMLVLVVYKSYLIQREESSVTFNNTWTGARLMRIMFRDSVIYFACTVGVNLFNLLMWALGPFDLFTVGTAWAVVVPVMAASRILFNMRKEYNSPLSTSTPEGDIGTEFQVAHRPPGSKGTTVWSATSTGDVDNRADEI
ncbi:hypothetical protein B0H19DRAFT_1263038 [Mycena capillaripes]|nr:hypothetical protein B0H19DRAFT_1263038 [Mycena capillaripes]